MYLLSGIVLIWQMKVLLKATERGMRMGKRILWIVAGCLLCMSACGNKNLTEPDGEKNAAELQKKKGNCEVEDVEASVNGTNTYFYSGKETVIKYQYMATGTPSVGIMLLCNGIALPFHTSENETDAIIQKIPLEDGKQKEVDLCFIPYGKKGEIATLEIVDIIDPDYDVTEGKKEDILSDYIHGLRYNVGYIAGINVNLNADGAVCEEQIYEKYTKEKIENYISGDNKEIYLETESSVNDEQSLWYTVEQGQPLDIHIRYAGNVPKEIVTSFYVDGKLYPAFDGMGYARCPVEEGYFTDIAGMIDTSGFEKGRHTVFSVCANGEYNATVPVRAFVFEIK